MMSEGGVEIGSTYQHPTLGTLWIVDYRGTAAVHMRPDFGYSIGVPDPVDVLPHDLLDHWTLVETCEQRIARRRRDRDTRCDRGYHDDPDNSGLCVHCGAVLYD